MNPFTTPDAIYISKRPQDMRAGIQRLAAIAAADFGRDPMDGALYCFVSRDCEKAKLLRSDVNGWCMYYVRLAEGGFKWRHAEGGASCCRRSSAGSCCGCSKGCPRSFPRPSRRSPPEASSDLKTQSDLRRHGIIFPWRTEWT